MRSWLLRWELFLSGSAEKRRWGWWIYPEIAQQQEAASPLGLLAASPPQEVKVGGGVTQVGNQQKQEGWPSRSWVRGGRRAYPGGASEEVQSLLEMTLHTEGKGGEYPGSSPPPARQSSASGSHWPNPIGSQRKRAPGKCSCLLYTTRAERWGGCGSESK